jgi:hypothetical protein
MEFKGTKSQWKIEGVDKTFVYALNEKGTNAFSLNINNDGRTEHIEQQANALLISKAPEMLEMVKKLMAYMPKKNIDDANMYYQALQLIKEATEI